MELEGLKNTFKEFGEKGNSISKGTWSVSKFQGRGALKESKFEQPIQNVSK